MMKFICLLTLLSFAATLADVAKDDESKVYPYQTIQLRIKESEDTLSRQQFTFGPMTTAAPPSSQSTCLSCQDRRHGLSKWDRAVLLERGQNDTTTIVRIFVTFHMTTNFRNSFTRQADIAYHIQTILDTANQGFINSQIPARLVLHSVIYNPLINDNTNDANFLFRSFINSSSSLDELRNYADVAIMLTAQGTIFNLQQPPTQPYTNYYYQESCIFDGMSSDLTLGILPRALFYENDQVCERSFVFGRCMATLFGANLDRTNSPQESLVSTAHGYYEVNPIVPLRGFRTIDTNDLQFSPATALQVTPYLMRWVNFYSNPSVIYQGVPAGDANNNNAQFMTGRRFLLSSIGDESRTSYRHDYSRLLILSDSTMEIIDVLSNMPICTAQLPFTLLGGIGGLDYDDQPVVCGEFRSGYTRRDCYVLPRIPAGATSISTTWTKSRLTLKADTGLVGHSSFDTRIFGRGRIVALANTDGNAEGMDRIQYLSPFGWVLSRAILPFRTTGACVSNINSTSVLILPGTDPVNGVSNRTFIYDFISDELFLGPDRPVASRRISCARLTNATTGRTSIVVAGGRLLNGNIDRSTYFLDLLNGTWVAGPLLPTPIFGGQLIEHPSGGVTYISGERYTNGTMGDTSVMFFLESMNVPWKQMIQLQNDCNPFNVAIPVPNSVTCPGQTPV